jgi:hypothetical protein
LFEKVAGKINKISSVLMPQKIAGKNQRFFNSFPANFEKVKISDFLINFPAKSC